MIARTRKEVKEFCRAKVLHGLNTITYDWELRELDKIIKVETEMLCDFLGIVEEESIINEIREEVEAI